MNGWSEAQAAEAYRRAVVAEVRYLAGSNVTAAGTREVQAMTAVARARLAIVREKMSKSENNCEV